MFSWPDDRLSTGFPHSIDACDRFSTPCEQTVTVAPVISHVLHTTRHHPDTAIGGSTALTEVSRSRRILARISRNSSRGTATSAIWNTTDRA